MVEAATESILQSMDEQLSNVINGDNVKHNPGIEVHLAEGRCDENLNPNSSQTVCYPLRGCHASDKDALCALSKVSSVLEVHPKTKEPSNLKEGPCDNVSLPSLESQLDDSDVFADTEDSPTSSFDIDDKMEGSLLIDDSIADDKIQHAVDDIREEASKMETALAIDQLQTLQNELGSMTRLLHAQADQIEHLKNELKAKDEALAIMQLERDLVKADMDALKADQQNGAGSNSVHPNSPSTTARQVQKAQYVPGEERMNITTELDEMSCMSEFTMTPLARLIFSDQSAGSPRAKVETSRTASTSATTTPQSHSSRQVIQACASHCSSTENQGTSSTPSQRLRANDPNIARFPITPLQPQRPIVSDPVHNASSVNSGPVMPPLRREITNSIFRDFELFEKTRNSDPDGLDIGNVGVVSSSPNDPASEEDGSSSHRMCGLGFFRRRRGHKARAKKKQDASDAVNEQDPPRRNRNHSSSLQAQVTELAQRLHISETKSEDLRKRVVMISRYYETTLQCLYDNIAALKREHAAMQLAMSRKQALTVDRESEEYNRHHHLAARNRAQLWHEAQEIAKFKNRIKNRSRSKSLQL